MLRHMILTSTALLLTLPVQAEPTDADIPREPNHRHRDEIDQLELNPFPAETWAQLEEWTMSFSPDEHKNDVILVTTWASWHAASHEALELAQQLHNKHADEGLSVIGIHHRAGWEKAPAVIERYDISFPCAHDQNHTFRKTLMANGDPEFYVIDRAGNLRFADIPTTAVTQAVNLTLAETPETAAQAKSRRKENAEKTSNQTDEHQTAPDVDFKLPDDDAYKNLQWPKHNKGNLNAKDVQGKKLPRQLGNETYITDKPHPHGRVIVLDFWATWCGPCLAASPKLGKLQEEFHNDLVIIGITAEAPGKIKQFLKTREAHYTIAVDQKRTIGNALQIRAIPHVVIVSTDGVVRWQGNPHSNTFEPALRQTIKVDPGIKVRQEAESKNKS